MTSKQHPSLGPSHTLASSALDFTQRHCPTYPKRERHLGTQSGLMQTPRHGACSLIRTEKRLVFIHFRTLAVEVGGSNIPTSPRSLLPLSSTSSTPRSRYFVSLRRGFYNKASTVAEDDHRSLWARLQKWTSASLRLRHESSKSSCYLGGGRHGQQKFRRRPQRADIRLGLGLRFLFRSVNLFITLSRECCRRNTTS